MQGGLYKQAYHLFFEKLKGRVNNVRLTVWNWSVGWKPIIRNLVKEKGVKHPSV